MSGADLKVFVITSLLIIVGTVAGGVGFFGLWEPSEGTVKGERSCAD